MNRSALKTTVVHYGYPGRHLRAVLANSTAKLVTNVTWTTSAYATLDSEIADAWPDEQQALMQRKGFHSSPADHVQLTHTATSRALDLLLHLRLHTARITPVTAAQLLVDEAGLPPAAAYTQVRHALLTPLGTP